ncbi:hypothetical protein SESBI_28891 [Sesbania bispinosa]|nr:hypothetical protein SESBI_28891 [Sesbania bispinosa]
MDDLAGSVSDENEMMKGMEEVIYYEEEEDGGGCNEECGGFGSAVDEEQVFQFEDECHEDGDSLFTQPKIKIDSEQEIRNMDLKSFIPVDITRKQNGFSVRKGRIAKSKRTGDILGRDYCCSNEGDYNTPDWYEP